MEKRLILEKVFIYNIGCGFTKTRFELKPLPKQLT